MRHILWAWLCLGIAHADAPKPHREIAVIVTKEGYYPKNLTVFQGERVKFYVTATVEEPECFIVQGQKIFMAANKGKVTEAEAVFEHAGNFAFYCPASKHDGKITVMKRADKATRGIASEPAKWVPKEYE